MIELIYFLMFQQFVTIGMFLYQTNSRHIRHIKHLEDRLDQEIMARRKDNEINKRIIESTYFNNK